jgi:hypothetical protein
MPRKHHCKRLPGKFRSYTRCRYERLQREGRLLNVGQWNRCTLFDVNFRPDRMSVEALERGLRDLMSKVYNKEFRAWRRDQFFRRLRRNRRLR